MRQPLVCFLVTETAGSTSSKEQQLNNWTHGWRCRERHKRLRQWTLPFVSLVYYFSRTCFLMWIKNIYSHTKLKKKTFNLNANLLHFLIKQYVVSKISISHYVTLSQINPITYLFILLLFYANLVRMSFCACLKLLEKRAVNTLGHGPYGF